MSACVVCAGEGLAWCDTVCPRVLWLSAARCARVQAGSRSGAPAWGGGRVPARSLCVAAMRAHGSGEQRGGARCGRRFSRRPICFLSSQHLSRRGARTM